MEPALPEKSRKGKLSSLNVQLSRSLCAFLHDLSPSSLALPLSLCVKVKCQTIIQHFEHTRGNFESPKSVAKIRLPRHVLGSRKGT